MKIMRIDSRNDSRNDSRIDSRNDSRIDSRNDSKNDSTITVFPLNKTMGEVVGWAEQVLKAHGNFGLF